MKLKMKPLSFAIVQALSMAFGATAISANAQTAAPATDKMEKIEVTGSSIRRAQFEGALPVTVVTKEEIAKLGVTSVEQLLSALTSNSLVGGNNVAQGVGASTYGESTASLRGLGANKTLVLVNGRRVANYATDGTAVDINSIPLAAVDHIDILKDGASAVYGSDAIAGVINFILRNNFIGTELSAYGSGTKDGGGTNSKVGVVVGFGDFNKDRYNIMFSADIAKDGAIYGKQRSYAQNAWDDGGAYDQSATPSGAIRTFRPTTTPNAQGIIPNTLTSQGSGLGNPLSPANCAQNGSAFDPNIGTCRFNFAPFAALTPEVKRGNLAASIRFKLSDNAEFFTDAFVTKQVTNTNAQPSPHSVSFWAGDSAFAAKNIYPAIILSPTNPVYPAAFIAARRPGDANNPVTVSYRAFDGGGRIHQDVATQVHVVSGFKGTFKDFDYDVAYIHNSSAVAESTQQGYQLQSSLAALLSNNNAFNPFVPTQSPGLAAQIFAANYNGPILRSVLSTDTLEAKISGDLIKLPAGSMSFAVGGLMRIENFDLTPSAAAQSGDVSGYGLQIAPLSKARSSTSIYVELNIPILKTLESNIALRSDTFGSTTSTNPKINFRYQPASFLLMRASYGKGFRIASLPELYNAQVNATTASFKDPVTGVLNQFQQLTGGNPKLLPEKSEQAAVGMVLDPVNGVSISVDYWKINVNNLITTLNPQFIVQQAAAGNGSYTGLVQRDALNNITQIQSTNLNAGGVATAGLDVDIRWQIIKTDNFGKFSTHLSGTYLTKYDQTLPDGTVQPSIASTIDANGNPLNAVSAGGILFRWKHILSLDWSNGPFGASLTQNFQSGYYDNARADSATGTDAERVKQFSTWDVAGSYEVIKNLTLRAGLKNMFNRKPPLSIGLGGYFQTGYDPTYYDAHGMTGWLTANYKF